MSKYSNDVNNYIMGIEQALDRSLGLLFACMENNKNVKYINGMMEGIIPLIPDEYVNEMSNDVIDKVKKYRDEDKRC